MSMPIKIVAVAGYATLIRVMCTMIYSCLTESKSCWRGPDISPETIMLTKIADCIAP